MSGGDKPDDPAGAPDPDRTILSPGVGSGQPTPQTAPVPPSQPGQGYPGQGAHDLDWPTHAEPGQGTPQPPVPPPPVPVTPQPSAPPVPPQSAPHEQTVTARWPSPEPLRVLSPGTVINNMYRVDQSLDQGGMGRVFRGVEISTGEPVAIKVILPEMAEDEKVAQMFRREARTLRQLQHKAIVQYFAYVPPDERLHLHALIMGFIEGTKLSDRLHTHGALSRAEVCDLFMHLADGLRMAHEIGVVHRDLSPDNVMLPGNDIRKAILIDFGISRSSKVRDVTIGNEFAGKLKYVSPEQLGAFGGDPDARSDVYSMGLLMIATLLGKPLPMGDSIVEAVQKRQEVPDLTGVPPEFGALLYQMLQPNPEMRPRDMGFVIDALEAISAEGTERSRPPITTSFYPQMATTPPAVTQTNNPVPGLQAAPTAAGQYGTIGPTSRPTQSPLSSAEADDAPGHGGAFTMLASVVLIAAVAIGGSLYWYFSDASTGLPSEVAGEEASAGPVRVAGTQETLLAESVGPECGFATLRKTGPHSGRIETFNKAGDSPPDLTSALGDAFGAVPDTVTRWITPQQCAVLDLARRFQGTQAPPVELAVLQQRITASEKIDGVATGSNGREDWLAIVAPTGNTFVATANLQSPIGAERRFSIELRRAPPGIYLFVLVSSQKALIRTGAMTDGDPAQRLFPLIGNELSSDSLASVSISALEITQ